MLAPSGRYSLKFWYTKLFVVSLAVGRLAFVFLRKHVSGEQILFINFWYAAEESDNVTSKKPVHVRMLGQDFVMFRDSSGQAHCLSNVCAHRGGSLAHGKLKDDSLECPYHGWRFNGDGACALIPSMGKDANIPSRAKVDSYPTQEKYGLIFAFLGDLPERERPPILEIPEWDKKDWRATLLVTEWNFDYKRSIENAIDLAHNEFTHTFQIHTEGDENFVVPDLELIESEWECGVRADLPGQKLGSADTAKMKKGIGDMEPGPSQIYTAYHGISSFRTYIHPTPDVHIRQYFFESPIDESHTRLFFINLRNFMIDPKDDEAVIEPNIIVVREDGDVLEQIRPVLTPETNTNEVLVGADKPIARYREWVRELEAKGWRIDVDKVAQTKGKVAYAIPGPSRRNSKGWALDPIPLISRKAAQLSTAAE